MTKIVEHPLKLKILDLDEFKDLVSALAIWAEEVATKSEKTKAEIALFEAAIDLSESLSPEQPT
ncbi:hypothetical protein [Pseudophaeobacter sp.]|jgi:hypothetical protein|uniref:hypothetical protein n=1 Tax=Pseudophaeobacter sp. TaxID=1971739 RepID=UPI0032D96928